eukprot:CAMPEP_0118634464 /NCGR_PEP_ID=MMETSP0785-20121206/1559_1 /TAXON_ID=91992 /ORGANISM="Bolidomonas pacifica, Strain CCMP 1866" /LENGTH=277 /DNA_ID=CAMNT_0006525437 /DNA_START=285 /DNA_END=1114 /DNA_ORIENTATION=+
MTRFFRSTPPPANFYTSHVISQGWLLAFRAVIFVYFFIVGFLMEWGLGPEGWSYTWNTTPSRFADDDVDGTNIPPAYLTNWGFCSVLAYFGAAMICSATNYKRRGGTNSPNPPTSPDSPQKTSPFSITLSSPPPPRPSTFHALTFYFFCLAVTIQPFIVVGYWALVFPYSLTCDYRCGTVHGAGFVLIYVELLLTKLVPDVKLLPIVIGYPAFWTVTQIIWIYTDHKPDYEVLPMDDWLSLVLTLGSLVFFIATFYVAKRLCEWRDTKWGFPGGVSG